MYYTSILIIDANVDDYSVALFSPSTAQKWQFDCETKICEIPGVSPFTYNISIIKQDYESEMVSMKIRPRAKESLVIALEKKVRLKLTEPSVIEAETNAEKIQRLRDENLYYFIESLSNDRVFKMRQDADQLDILLVHGEVTKDL